MDQDRFEHETHGNAEWWKQVDRDNKYIQEQEDRLDEYVESIERQRACGEEGQV